MEPTKSTENLTIKMGDDNNKIHLALIVIAIVVAVVSLIVACVGISQKGTTQITVAPSTGTSTTGSYDNKIWTIALGHANYNEAYIDEESGLLKGFLVDWTNAVCASAGKNCRIVYDIWLRCWDSEEGQVARGGIGLMGDWYDICAGWLGTYDRYRTFTFSEPWAKAKPTSLFVKPGSPLKSSWKDMSGKKIGILDGWATDEFCLKRNQDQFTGGVPLTTDQIVHYNDPPELVEAINNGEVDYAFAGLPFLADDLERVEGDPTLPCSVHGNSMMVRKVREDVLDWWNPAQKQLMATSQYRTICNDLAEEHGHKPGLDPESYCFL